MTYTKNVTDKIDFIDGIFSELNIPSILNNSDFEIDQNWAFDNYIKFSLCKPGSVQLSITVQDTGMSICIDRCQEIFDWGDVDFKNNSCPISEWLKIVMTSTIRIEYCGKNYTKLYFIDKHGAVIKTAKHIRGFYLKINCSSTEYEPIYKSQNIEDS